jgi:hypothetical protein
MNPTFHLTEAEVDSILTDFRHRRDLADANEQYQAAAAWGEAITLLQDAQLAAFQTRPRRKLGLRLTR